jgi:outer membrane protein OmpA-like peptidoglycan-associated protein
MSLSRRALALVFAMLLLNSTGWVARGQDTQDQTDTGTTQDTAGDTNRSQQDDDDDDDRFLGFPRGSVHDDMDEDECERLNQMKAPTVYGGTGLFNTYSTRTLDAGEFSVGVFWNNFDRDPGDVDINQGTINLTVGFAERWEVWANLVAYQQTTVRQPFLLSSYGYNAVLASGRSPFVFFGPAIGGTDGGAAFFPGTGAFGGGILPVLGRFGTPITSGVPGAVIISPFGQPGGAIGLGPAIVTDRASYLPDLPFVGQVDFFGFDNFGRPVFGPRQSGNGLGDAHVGTKVEVIDPDDNWFSMALGFQATIPTARNQRALARGRTSGEVDLMPFIAFGQEWGEGVFRLYENVSYTWAGDPEVGDIKVLDRPNSVGLGIGLSIAPSDNVELIGEVNSKHYIGGQTPNFNQRDPIDLTVGARFFFLDGQVSFGGAYRRLLNGQDEVTVPVLNLTGFTFVPAPPPTVVEIPIFNFVNQTFDGGDKNGFVAYFGFGPRGECVTPPPPNAPPVCRAVTADRTEVIVGESVSLTADASDPDGDVLVYTWTATGGRVVGSGATVTFDTTGLTPGTYTVTAQVDDGFGHVVDCAVTITVQPKPNVCPTVTLSADKFQVSPGEVVTFTATATDPDNGPGPISYNWTSTAGSLQGSGNVVTLDTTGLEGSITVTVTVSDTDPACQDTESVTVTVTAPPVIPIDIITPCSSFRRNNARIDNACKAILDDAALRLQQDPRRVLVIDGHSDTGERAGIALRRAENARDYLVNERGVDANRIIVRSFDDKCPQGDAAQNRRIEMFLLPEGRTVDEVEKNCPGATGTTP